MSSPALAMQATIANPRMPQMPLKEADIGNAIIRLPEQVLLTSSIMENLKVWEILDQKSGGKMQIPPSREAPPDAFKAFSDSIRMTGESVSFTSNVEFDQYLAQAKPVSWWDSFRMGRMEFYRRISLATAKSVSWSNFSAVQTFERGPYRFIVFYRKDGPILIRVAKNGSHSSRYAMTEGREKAAMLIDVFLCSYESKDR